jgi:molybdopterin synthase sulfur carrier subunit
MRILYFAWVRERVGLGEETLSLPEGIATLRDLAGWLAARGENYAAAFSDLRAIRAALDQNHASLETPIAGAREVAFFPPVTGGWNQNCTPPGQGPPHTRGVKIT